MSESNPVLFSRTPEEPVPSPADAERPLATSEREAALEAQLADARERLHAQEERFRSIVERSVDGVIVLDPQGWVLFANSAAEKLFGRKHEELIGLEFGYPAVAGENTEIDLLRAEGEPGTAEMRVVETTWAGEDALLVLIRDVTAEKQALERERVLVREQAARAEAEAHARRAELLDHAGRVLNSTLDLEELLRGLAGVIVEEIGDVCLIDIDDQNGPMRRIAAARRDYPRQTVLRGLEERPVWLGLHTAEARVFRTGASELVREVTSDWLEKDETAGTFTMLRACSLMMVTLHAGHLRWGVVNVLSCDPAVRYGPADIALLEELVRRAAITIENARLFRLAHEAGRAKSDFLAIVSHELRTPLSAIVGYTGLLEEKIVGDLTKTQGEYLAAVRRSADHLMRLIDQIITFARLEGDHERLEVDRVDLCRVLDDIATLTRPLADRKGLALTLDVPAGDPVLETDDKKLSQILINLVTNAIKYTDDGEVQVQAVFTDEEVLVRVRDTGPGIPVDRQTEIFEPFRQLEDPRTRREGGAGIGLSIVKNLTCLLGGEVGVASRPGQGSTFTVRLPRVYGRGAVRA